MKPSFPRRLPEPLSVADLLALGGDEPLSVTGDTGREVASVASAADADATSVCFVRGRSPSARRQVAETAAALVLVEDASEAPRAGALAVVPDACRFLARVLDRLLAKQVPDAGAPAIHPQARIHPSAVLGAHVVVEADVEVGAESRIDAHAVLHDGTRIGQGCQIGAASVLSRSDPSPYRDESGSYQLPSLGYTLVDDEVVVGAHATLVRGVLSDTWIGRGALIGNHVNVGRNCRIGAECDVFVGAMLCGSVELGERVVVGAAACLNNGVRVGSGASIGLGAVVTRHVPERARVFGNPARTRG